MSDLLKLVKRLHDAALDLYHQGPRVHVPVAKHDLIGIVEDWRRLDSEYRKARLDIITLKGAIEFHERNAKIMEQALLAAEKKADSWIQRINQLENRLETVKVRLGSLSYVVDYPDEEAASIVEDLCRDAYRYRFIRITDGACNLHALICYRNRDSKMQCFVDGEQADAVIDSLMLQKSPGGSNG